jgi:solute:Na+ symporter, SSS family
VGGVIHLKGIDWLIVGFYFLFVLGIGVVLRRRIHSSEDFFLSRRSIPAWVAGRAQ